MGTQINGTKFKLFTKMGHPTDYYHDKMVRIGSEIMHILLDAPPPTNINGVYQETDITNMEADKAHRVLKK